jgi:hypothetical protein
MKIWIPAALVFALSAACGSTAANADPCTRDKSRNCFNVPATINFSSVPEISDQIVSQDKTQHQLPKNPAKTEPLPAPYTGPIIGVSPLRSRIPTVGFSWSLD